MKRESACLKEIEKFTFQTGQHNRLNGRHSINAIVCCACVHVRKPSSTHDMNMREWRLCDVYAQSVTGNKCANACSMEVSKDVLLLFSCVTCSPCHSLKYTLSLLHFSSLQQSRLVPGQLTQHWHVTYTPRHHGHHDTRQSQQYGD